MKRLLNPNNFYDYKDNVHISPSLEPDNKLYRYTDLPVLFQIADNNFRISKRKTYEDGWEYGYDDLRGVDHLYPVCSYIDPEEVKRRKELRKLTTHLLTTCFTLSGDELNFMWNDYTSGCLGMRIGTTVGKFINSLSLNDYEVFVAPVEYSKYDIGVTNQNFLFTKRLSYKPENEVRFYFIPKVGEIDDVTDNHVFLHIAGLDYIDEIILSPALVGLHKFTGWLYKSLKETFPMMSDIIRHSNII